MLFVVFCLFVCFVFFLFLPEGKQKQTNKWRGSNLGSSRSILSIKGTQHLELAFQITLYLEAKGSDLTGDFLEAHWKHPMAMILHLQLHYFHAVLSQWREGQ